jgi:hypothetical protein
MVLAPEMVLSCQYSTSCWERMGRASEEPTSPLRLLDRHDIIVVPIRFASFIGLGVRTVLAATSTTVVK